MKRYVIDCTDEMAVVIQQLAKTGEVRIKEESDSENPIRSPKRNIREFIGMIPEADRESWRQYAKSLGMDE